MKSKVVIPVVTRKRMVQLLQILKAWPKDRITSIAISETTGWKDSLVRHDLWLLGCNNGVSNGYQVDDLRMAISQALGIENQVRNQNEEIKIESSDCRNCCIVGLGRLGAALLDDEITAGSSFKIKAGFDSNLYRVEILRSNFPLYPADEMKWIIQKEKIEYAILAVKDESAQKLVDRLVSSGIKGIVNMTNVILKVPQSVKVENISIMNALNLVI